MQALILSIARRLAWGLFWMAAILVLAAYALSLTGLSKSYAYKYRLTVSIRDHGELKSASNVVGVIESVGPAGGSGRPLKCGETTVIRLKNGRILFALLNGVNRDAVIGQFHWRSVPTGVLLNRLGLETEFSWKDDSGMRRLPATRTRIDHLKPYEMPEFVTFRDISDPTTLERVDPENPELTLGEGVRFENVALEASGDWITSGVVKPALPWMNRFPWLSRRNEYLDRSPRGRSVGGYQVVQFKTCNRRYLLQRSIMATGG